MIIVVILVLFRVYRLNYQLGVRSKGILNHFANIEHFFGQIVSKVNWGSSIQAQMTR
jgi:hypothetical protein